MTHKMRRITAMETCSVFMALEKRAGIKGRVDEIPVIMT